MWVFNFVVFGVVNGVVRALLNDPLGVVPLLTWPLWMATLETFVLTWYTLRQRAKAAPAGAASAE